MEVTDKLAKVEAFLRALPGALVAYSGGADSSFLAEVSHRTLGSHSIAMTADSPSLPRRELRAAVELARSRGWQHEIIATRELEDDRYASNPVDRCYFCKSALFDSLGPMSASRGWPVLLGTNTDDLGDWRPGSKAADERGALYPMVEAGLSKDDVRSLSRQIGLLTADKPASACLASRFKYGVTVTSKGLARVEAAEDELLSRGFEVVRVRDLGDDRARVEVGLHELESLRNQASSVIERLRSIGFRSVEIDERGYRPGALNEQVLIAIEVRP